MKITFKLLLILCITLIYACHDDDDDYENITNDYIICESGVIININDRENNISLSTEEWPVSIRTYIASEFPGFFIESISKYNFLSKTYFIAKLNNGGYILFDSNQTYLCADSSFNGGPRVDIGVLIDTTVKDTIIVVDPDSLINIIEANVCDPDEISFERQILPLMVSGCAYSGCHDATTREEGVFLETYNGIRKEVSPNNLNGSEIIKTFRANINSDKYMPPRPALSFTAEQMKLVEDWILQGAQNTDCNIPCNSLESTWTENVLPLLQNHCIGCHQGTNDQGGISLETYENVLTYINNGKLIGSIKHDQNYHPMPKVAKKLTDCQIATIENWITQGALRN